MIEHQIMVVGVNFRLKKELREELAATLKHGPLDVNLDREPENKYDANAIKVTITEGDLEGHHLGYVGRETAEVLAPRLDDGTMEIAFACLVGLDGNNDNKIGVMDVTLEEVA